MPGDGEASIDEFDDADDGIDDLYDDCQGDSEEGMTMNIGHYERFITSKP